MPGLPHPRAIRRPARVRLPVLRLPVSRPERGVSHIRLAKATGAGVVTLATVNAKNGRRVRRTRRKRPCGRCGGELRIGQWETWVPETGLWATGFGPHGFWCCLRCAALSRPAPELLAS
jgi:hypothetical protein